MKTPLHDCFKKCFYVIPFCFFLLISIACSKDNDMEIKTSQDPLVEAKANFSKALSLWNNPDNFNTSNGKSEADLLLHRLELVQEDSKNLLLASGMTENMLQTKNAEEIFIAAIKVYGELHKQK